MTDFNANDVHTKVMLVELRVSQWTARKQDRRVADAVASANHVDAKVGAYYKSLLDPEILESIKKHVTETRAKYYKATLPWSDDGPRILTADLYFDFMNEMNEARTRFESNVNAFLSDYPYHREEAKRFLGSLFRDEDYPEPEELAKKFGFALHVRPLPISSDFRCSLGGDEVDRIREQIEQDTADTLQSTVRSAFERIYEVASRYADRLADPKNVFRDSMVESAQELAELMPKLNFTNDPELARLTEVVRDKLAAHKPDALRHNHTVRAEAAAAAKNVVSDIESFFGGAFK